MSSETHLPRRPRNEPALNNSIPHVLRSIVEWLPIDALHPFTGNARLHSPKQVRQIASSLEQFGFTNPVLIDDACTILAGHGRIEAARVLGLAEVPTLRLERLSEAQKRAYVLADNRLAELAGWDQNLLSIELHHLVELDFNIELTGFSTAEFDALAEARSAADDAADRLPEHDPKQPPVSRVGDLWHLGRHRLICAYATNSDAFHQLLGDARPQMVFSDPPYNLQIDGNVCGTGRIRHDEFIMASGEMSSAEFTEFLGTVFRNLAAYSINGSIHFICMDWRHMREILDAAKSCYELKNLCIWNKDNAGLGSFYRSKHELVFVFKSGDGPHVNNFRLGETGRYRTNVWDYPGINTLRPERIEELSLHPTVKPVALVADAIRDCSKPNAIILDAFAGSGTTLIAAERTRRKAFAVELDPKYVDIAIRRWEAFTGGTATHAATGRSLAELTLHRSAQSLQLRETHEAPFNERL
jgi:DNA modification methylase